MASGAIPRVSGEPGRARRRPADPVMASGVIPRMSGEPGRARRRPADPVMASGAIPRMSGEPGRARRRPADPVMASGAIPRMSGEAEARKHLAEPASRDPRAAAVPWLTLLRHAAVHLVAHAMPVTGPEAATDGTVRDAAPPAAPGWVVRRRAAARGARVRVVACVPGERLAARAAAGPETAAAGTTGARATREGDRPRSGGHDQVARDPSPPRAGNHPPPRPRSLLT
jgi:hypothetical protein